MSRSFGSPGFSVRLPDSDPGSQTNADPDPGVTRLLSVSVKAAIKIMVPYKLRLRNVAI